MSRIIIKITDPTDQKDYYMDWSTIVDAPVTYGMSLEEFKEYYREEYGESRMPGLQERLDRVAIKGSSGAYGNYDDVDKLIELNRAGKDESCLTKEGILDEYCRKRGG
jgi:hypothetical protein